MGNETDLLADCGSLLGACGPGTRPHRRRGKKVSLADLGGKPLLVQLLRPLVRLPAGDACNALHQEGQIRVIAINYDPAYPAELTELARRHAIRGSPDDPG